MLVAEDNVMNQRVASLLLTAMGYHADMVANGDQAIAAVRSAPYDVVLMDLAMPATDGISATRAIRQLGADVHQPYIVALTAHSFPSDAESCLDAGMDDFVAKPIDRAELARALAAGAARRHRAQPSLPVVLPSIPAGGSSLLTAGPALAASGRPTPPPGPAEAGRGSRPDFDASVAVGLATEFGPEALRRLAAIFRAEGNRLVASVCAAVAAGDAEGAQHAAHSLKSSAANLGAVALSASCSALEAKARTGSLLGTGTLAAAIVAQLAEALRGLDEVAPPES